MDNVYPRMCGANSDNEAGREFLEKFEHRQCRLCVQQQNITRGEVRLPWWLLPKDREMHLPPVELVLEFFPKRRPYPYPTNKKLTGVSTVKNS